MHSTTIHKHSKDQVEQNTQLQANLMLMVIQRMLKTIQWQLNGETYIVQCFLLELRDFKDIQAQIDIH